MDWKALGLVDYPDIVKRPMDLGTIKKKLENGITMLSSQSFSLIKTFIRIYTSVHSLTRLLISPTGSYNKIDDVANDIRLVWTNCMLYNRDGSEFYHLASAFAKHFEGKSFLI